MKSKLGFGFLRLPEKEGSGEDRYDWDKIDKLVDRYMELGGSWFDTLHRLWILQGSLSDGNSDPRIFQDV